MKLTRFLHNGSPTPGLFLDDHTILNASSFGEDWNEIFDCLCVSTFDFI